MKVVEHLDLMLDLQAAAEREQSQVVFQLVAQIRVRIRQAELVARPRGDEAIAAETDVKERRDRTGRLIRK